MAATNTPHTFGVEVDIFRRYRRAADPRRSCHGAAESADADAGGHLRHGVRPDAGVWFAGEPGHHGGHVLLSLSSEPVIDLSKYFPGLGPGPAGRHQLDG